jgi:hypothetical protein
MIKLRLFGMLIMIGFLLAINSPLGAAEDDLFFYEYLDHKILLCKSKSLHIDSESETIRKTAQKSIRMAQYLMQNRELLVKAMVAEKIEPKPYKIDFFLNNRYGEKWDIN